MSRTFQAIADAAGQCQDILVHEQGRSFAMLGQAGARRELALLHSWQQRTRQDVLPVLAGSGLGHALGELCAHYDGPIAVVDKEQDLLQITRLQNLYPDARILWVQNESLEDCLKTLTHWQQAHGGKAFLPLVNPFYLRLDRNWYNELHTVLKASLSCNFWDKAVTPRFSGTSPRVLLITSKYFLVGEMVDACKRLGYPHYLLSIENESIASSTFVEQLLEAVVTFKPDCVLTMNHLGVDREGVLTELLATLRLPMGSWFVDNPHLILHLYQRLVNPWTVLFTWDADNIPSLRALGFEHVHHLPLATDIHRFKPPAASSPAPKTWHSDVSFVGNSMIYKVGKKLGSAHFPRALLKNYKQHAALFADSDERSVREHILSSPELAEAYTQLPDAESRLSYEAMLTWEATRQYRATCVSQTLPFNPLIAGDAGWNIQFKRSPHTWRKLPELSYYSDLPHFYSCSAINFNCTSKQMKGAVNQRVFDVPATGAFVLTDWREQMDALFEPGKELVCYREPQEAGELIAFYLKNPEARKRISQAARKRIIAHHTWDHRLAYMVSTLRHIYA